MSNEMEFNLGSSLLDSDSDLSDAAIEREIDESIPSNTKKQTKWGLSKIEQWLDRRASITVDWHNDSAEKLNEVLRKFYMEIKTAKKTNLSPGSLSSIRAAIQRFLSQPPVLRNINIISGKEFLSANQAFKTACKRYVKQGGPKPRHKSQITEVDMQKLKEYLQDWKTSPVVLQQACWFLLCLHFGRRGREGWRQMTTNTFTLERDAHTGKRFVTTRVTEATKNHQGGERLEETDYGSVRMYEDDTLLDPVSVYEMHLKRLDSRSNVLFQEITSETKRTPENWFNGRPIGVNTLNEIMKTMSRNAKLPSLYPNHCVRATCIGILSVNKVKNNIIRSITLQKSDKSLESYQGEPNNATKEQCSRILSSAGAPVSSGAATSGFSDISDDELLAAEVNVMRNHTVVNSTTSITQKTFSTPLTEFPMILGEKAIFNNCSFNINISGSQAHNA